jgi:hypothetical protein
VFTKEILSVPKEVDDKLARATLVALRAALPMQHEAFGWGYAFLPSQAPMSREEVLKALVELPKPILCAGFALDGALAIATWPRPADTIDESVHRAAVLRDFPGARLLFEIDGEAPVVLTPEEMFRWRDDYEVLGLGVSWQWSDDDPLARVHAATTIVDLSRLHPRPDVLAQVIRPRT